MTIDVVGSLTRMHFGLVQELEDALVGRQREVEVLPLGTALAVISAARSLVRLVAVQPEGLSLRLLIEVGAVIDYLICQRVHCCCLIDLLHGTRAICEPHGHLDRLPGHQ